MSRIEPLLKRNRAFALTGAHEGQEPKPNLGLFVITCLDPRVDPAHLLGTELGDLVVVRNEGGRVTEDVIAKVAFIVTLVELSGDPNPGFELAVIHHTNCMTSYLANDEVRKRYADRIGADEAELVDLAVIDPAATVAHDVALLRAAPVVPPSVTVSGHVYDVSTGLITTVVVENAIAESSGKCAVPGAEGAV